MKTFQINERPFVAPVDLQTLNTAYNSLQTRHDEAIKATSELKTAIANLNLNEAEEGFRQQLVADIENTIDSNTQFGNAAGAYNDIIKLSGNIASNPALIGRLKAQQEYQKYQALIDSADMPDDYKEYFKEKNPYYYRDTVDSNGKVTGGTTWKAVKSPTKVINLSDLITKGIQRAAEESGGGQVTRWLDKDGRPTTDINQAFDGEVYDVTTNQWERLTPEKIRQGINSVIEETPGAKESLDQDYDVALWKHNKNASSTELTVSDITDKNGGILSRKDYLDKRINPSIQAASYNNRISKTTYGDGLSTYKAAKKKAESDAFIAELNRPIAASSASGTPIEVEINVGGDALERKNTIYQTISKELKTYDPNFAVDNTYESLSNAVESIPITESNKNQISLFKEYLNMYKEAQANLDIIMEPMAPEDKANYEFALRMLSGGQMVKDGSKYDNTIINTTNSMFGEGDYISIDFDNEALINDFISKVTANKYNLESLGVAQKGNKIIVPRDARNSLPLLCNLAESVKSETNLGFWGTIGGMFNNRVNFTQYDKDGNPTLPKDSYAEYSQFQEINPMSRYASNLSGTYRTAERIKSNGSDKYNVNPNEITVSVELLPGNTFNHTALYQAYQAGIIDGPTYEKEIKYQNESLNREILTHDYTQSAMYYSEGGKTLKIVKDSNERYKYGHLLQLAINEDRAVPIPAHASGIYDPLTNSLGGYYFKIYPDKKAKDKEDESKAMVMYVPGLGNETGREMLMSDPNILINDASTKIIETRSIKYLTTAQSNPNLGDVKVQGLATGIANLNFKGKDIIINKDQLNDITSAIYQYDRIKRSLINKPEGVSNRDWLIATNNAATLDNIALTLSTITGFDLKAITSDISKPFIQ